MRIFRNILKVLTVVALTESSEPEKSKKKIVEAGFQIDDFRF